MTEMGASPERQGWFAGLKSKVSKELSRFTVEGAKKNFYEKNADVIARATANLSEEDKQKAYAMIEQDAQFAANADVALHWGTAVVGTTAATLGIGALTPKGRDIMSKHGGSVGRFVAEKGQNASDFFVKVLSRKNVVRVGQAGGERVRKPEVPSDPLARLRFKVENNMKVLQRRKDMSDEAKKKLRENGNLLAAIKRAEAGTLSDHKLQGEIDKIAQSIKDAQGKMPGVRAELDKAHTQTDFAGFRKGLGRLGKIVEEGDDQLKAAVMKAVKR